MQTKELVEALEKCRDRFRQYQHAHSIKGTPDADAKSLSNRAMAEMCDRALALPTSSGGRGEAWRPDREAAVRAAIGHMRADGFSGGFDVEGLVDAILALPASPSQERRAGIYVASRASLPERGRMWRALRASGVQVNSTWIDEDGAGQTADNSELWLRIEQEVTSSRLLVLYVEPGDFPLKGALVEVGMALAAGIPVRVVAPGLELEPHTMRPLGSWSQHPLVEFAASIADAVEPSHPSTASAAANQDPANLCGDCPPVGYPTEKTRCLECPRRNPENVQGEA